MARALHSPGRMYYGTVVLLLRFRSTNHGREPMTQADDDLSILEFALGLPETSLILRSAGAIAEIRGPLPLRRGPAWLTLGDEGGTHVHLKAADIRGCVFSDPPDANAALTLLGRDDVPLCKISFRGTNPLRATADGRARAIAVQQHFGHLRAVVS
jgi:hypothetical protein